MTAPADHDAVHRVPIDQTVTYTFTFCPVCSLPKIVVERKFNEEPGGAVRIEHCAASREFVQIAAGILLVATTMNRVLVASGYPLITDVILDRVQQLDHELPTASKEEMRRRFGMLLP